MYEALRTELETEARAKITWGEDAESVTTHLTKNGFEPQEAEAFVKQLKAERAKVIRSTGIKRILIGFPCIFVPFIFWIVYSNSPMFPTKLFGGTIAVGAFGAWKFMTGVLNIVFPEMEPGDLGERSRL